MTLLYIFILVLIALLVWWLIPYSPLKDEFIKADHLLMQKVTLLNSTFTREKLATQPALLQKYFAYCNLIEQPMMKSSYTVHNRADFLLNDHKPMIKIQYEHTNYATLYERIAFIDTKIAGIMPLQGIDDNINGKGRMHGVLGKLITLFDVQGPEMDVSALVTVLAEGIVCPSFLIQDSIVWNKIDDSHLQATLTQNNLAVTGIFEFSQEGAIISFTTQDRYEENAGTLTKQDWKIVCGNYQELHGIKRPTSFKSSWVYTDSEKIYFNCEDVIVQFRY